MNTRPNDPESVSGSGLLGGRLQFARDLRDSGAYWYFSAITFSLRRALLPLVRGFCSGKVLDAGAGGLHARQLLGPNCEEYVAVDIADQRGELDMTADVQDLAVIEDARFDCVFCSQVLEHLPRPGAAVSEFFRVLKPGGYLILAVPHLSALHEEPHDYFRYTQYGVNHLLTTAGFENVSMTSAGGLLTFIAHPFSYVLNSFFWRIPVVRWIAWLINLVLLVLPAWALDHLLQTQRRWPTNIIAVGRKP